ncbi:MAG TPA: hypothetical protein QF353_03475 [Gammaproteobacteria bacterium]|nr:hypothetical protein [Gammaproteobacteria bacterium]
MSIWLIENNGKYSIKRDFDEIRRSYDQGNELDKLKIVLEFIAMDAIPEMRETYWCQYIDSLYAANQFNQIVGVLNFHYSVINNFNDWARFESDSADLRESLDWIDWDGFSYRESSDFTLKDLFEGWVASWGGENDGNQRRCDFRYVESLSKFLKEYLERQLIAGSQHQGEMLAACSRLEGRDSFLYNQAWEKAYDANKKKVLSSQELKLNTLSSQNTSPSSGFFYINPIATRDSIGAELAFLWGSKGSPRSNDSSTPWPLLMFVEKPKYFRVLEWVLFGAHCVVGVVLIIQNAPLLGAMLIVGGVLGKYEALSESTVKWLKVSINTFFGKVVLFLVVLACLAMVVSASMVGDLFHLTLFSVLSFGLNYMFSMNPPELEVGEGVVGFDLLAMGEQVLAAFWSFFDVSNKKNNSPSPDLPRGGKVERDKLFMPEPTPMIRPRNRDDPEAPFLSLNNRTKGRGSFSKVSRDV